MLSEADLPYFRERERRERQAADAATHLCSRSVHLRLADHYADRVWALEQQQKRSPARHR